jgi:hypothetical protein
MAVVAEEEALVIGPGVQPFSESALDQKQRRLPVLPSNNLLPPLARRQKHPPQRLIWEI